MHKKHNTIKVKVIGWSLLAGLAVLLTGIISYNSYRDLLRSLEGTSFEETKLVALGEILADITEAEAKMRAYSLTRESEQLQEYQQLVIDIQDALGQVKKVEPINEDFNHQVDSVSLLLSRQTEGIESFLELKQYLNQLNFSSLALEEIASATDSVPAVRTTTTTTTTTTRVDPILPADEEENRKNTRRQQKKRAQEIAKELLKQEQEPQIQTETRVETDTSFVQPDTVLENIQDILVELGQEESRYQQIMAKRELNLVESSVQIIDQIRGLISSLEKQELAANIKMANDAKLIASKSTLTISIIIFVCLILGILFTYLIFRDVRISDFYNRQLIGAKNQAEQLAKSKQQFLATMSHEIRTPLNAIIGFTEQLSTTTLQPRQKEYLEAVQSSGEHLLNTVNDILDYSKIEAGELKITKKPFELNNCIREVAAALEIKATQKGLDLRVIFTPDQPIAVLGDAFRLRQILLNLIGNAVKFTDSGYVEVETDYHVDDDTAAVEIAVRDSGIGIPESMRAEIFTDFKQVDDTMNRKYQGTGLGLAICKKLVDLQGGTIRVDSNKPHGSLFTVTLFYQVANSLDINDISNTTYSDSSVGNGSETSGSTEQPAASVATAKLQQFKILVADDDPFNIRLLRTILEKYGVNGTYCGDGKEAMQEIERQDFDLVLTDINMPSVGGLELSSHIRSLKDRQQAKVPILAITANVMEGDLLKFRESGIDGFVLKPFREEELVGKVIEALGLKIPQSTIQPQVTGTATTEFKLDDFKKFSGGDNEALRPMLEAFHQSLRQDLENMKVHASHQNYEEVSKLAHKMISSFGHLHAMEPVKKLRTLETAIKSDTLEQPLEQMVNEIFKVSEPILEGLVAEMELL